MDSQSMNMLHVYMLDHMRKSGMHQTADIFAREAGINNADSGRDQADGFLRDWWCLFWDYYTSIIHTGSNHAEDTPESSTAQAQALSLSQGQAQAHDEIQAYAQTLANSGMLGYDPYANTLGQIWGQQYYANNVNMLSESILASTWNNERIGVLPGYINADFNPGWTFPSINPSYSTDQVARCRMVNRPASRIGGTNGSNPA